MLVTGGTGYLIIVSVPFPVGLGRVCFYHILPEYRQKEATMIQKVVTIVAKREEHRETDFSCHISLLDPALLIGERSTEPGTPGIDAFGVALDYGKFTVRLAQCTCGRRIGYFICISQVDGAFADDSSEVYVTFGFRDGFLTYLDTDDDDVWVQIFPFGEGRAPAASEFACKIVQEGHSETITISPFSLPELVKELKEAGAVVVVAEALPEAD